jgi:putative membrane protein insertion efficiency factor
MMPEDEPLDSGHRAPVRRPSIPARIVLIPVHVYRTIVSPLMPPSCRFYPSCSAYAVEALTVHGAARGSWLTLRRLLRCGPWHPGGLDPVPPRQGAVTGMSGEPVDPGSARVPEPPAEE